MLLPRVLLDVLHHVLEYQVAEFLDLQLKDSVRFLTQERYESAHGSDATAPAHVSCRG